MNEHEMPRGAVNIGEEAKPPYAFLPDPGTLFQRRQERLNALAEGHALEPYLRFAAEVTAAQHAIQGALPPVAAPSPSQIETSLEHAIPPLARASHLPGAAETAAVRLLLQAVDASAFPNEARQAMEALNAASDERLCQLLGAALKDTPLENIAERVLTLAALQVIFTRLAALLPGERLKPIADGVCPACGGPPMTSAVLGAGKLHNTRFCACSLCGTLWHVVRVKCVLCSSTGGISYHSIEGKPETVKAETCENCGRYVKILYQVKDPALDFLSDDVATLDLDMLMAKEGYERGGFNLFLLGY